MDSILLQKTPPVENIQSQPVSQNKSRKKTVLLISLMLFMLFCMFAIFAGLYYFSIPNTKVHSDAVVSKQNIYNNEEISSVPSVFSQTLVTQSQLEVLAGNKYANGNLPLGDNKYVTSNPKKGYIYLCNVNKDQNGGGAQTAGSWIHGNYWNIKEKISVQGSVVWPNATFSNTTTGDTRTLSGNDLPTHATGIFPIASTDPAYIYDKNPNSIKTQSFINKLPINPMYSKTPYCMGGEAGIMLTGVALFNAFDADFRDAPAYEVQDSCNGHPQVTGEYHYHSLSNCITNVDETNIIGYALDGFPITGPKVATNKYLTTEDLDECHGITSQIMLGGNMTTTYHYVMTQDFPYSVSCFRGKPVNLQVISGGQSGTMQEQPQSRQNHQPPQEAFSSCLGKSIGINCSFTSPNGTINGTCQIPPDQSSLVCVPANHP